MPEEILLMDKITKVYPNGFVANKDVTFSINKGEIHALVGENGAGKTTLMKILFGIEQPEEGRIVIKGKEVKINNPLEAIANGVGMVHQHFMLVPSLTVAENVVLGMEPKKNGLVDEARAIAMTQEMSSSQTFSSALRSALNLSRADLAASFMALTRRLFSFSVMAFMVACASSRSF